MRWRPHHHIQRPLVQRLLDNATPLIWMNQNNSLNKDPLVHIPSIPCIPQPTPIRIPPNKFDTTNNRQIKLPDEIPMTTNPIIRIVTVGVDSTPEETTV